MAAVLKTAEVQASVSSDLTRSASDSSAEAGGRRGDRESWPRPAHGDRGRGHTGGRRPRGRPRHLAGSSGCGLPADRACLRVLFIGNSYTSTNDLPGVLASPVAIRRTTRGGLRHRAGWRDARRPRGVGRGRRRDHRLALDGCDPAGAEPPAGRPGAPRGTDPPGRPHSGGCGARHGCPVYLFQTWAHRDGWPERRLDRAAMQAAITATDREHRRPAGPGRRARRRGVGSALREAPGIALWQADGSHRPPPARTWRRACSTSRSRVAARWA